MSGVTDLLSAGRAPVEDHAPLPRSAGANFAIRSAIITKNQLVTRDIDLLSSWPRTMPRRSIFPSRRSTPNSARPGAARFRAARAAGRDRAALRKAGVPVGVMIAPIIPGLTDHEIPAILAGGGRGGRAIRRLRLVRLPHAVAPLFEQWLETHFPDRKEKVLNRLRAHARRRNFERFAFKCRACEAKEFSPTKSAISSLQGAKSRHRRTASLSTAGFHRPNEQLTLL